MEDTCSPGKNTTLYSFRAWSIIIPLAMILVFLELVYIIATIPGNLGSALTIKGEFLLPKLPTHNFA